MNLGEWTKPFSGDSPAKGLIECLIQSDNCPLKFQFEYIYKVKIEEDTQ